ncbi:MAG: hypothetical protein HYV26_13730 [Candidatus Hydrogenedentes bacterium]|nr:hypothetical protein [Candidatus Hydrogenedentota bacterium]
MAPKSPSTPSRDAWIAGAMALSSPPTFKLPSIPAKSARSAKEQQQATWDWFCRAEWWPLEAALIACSKVPDWRKKFLIHHWVNYVGGRTEKKPYCSRQMTQDYLAACSAIKKGGIEGHEDQGRWWVRIEDLVKWARPKIAGAVIPDELQAKYQAAQGEQLQGCKPSKSYRPPFDLPGQWDWKDLKLMIKNGATIFFQLYDLKWDHTWKEGVGLTKARWNILVEASKSNGFIETPKRLNSWQKRTTNEDSEEDYETDDRVDADTVKRTDAYAAKAKNVQRLNRNLQDYFKRKAKPITPLQSGSHKAIIAWQCAFKILPEK